MPVFLLEAAPISGDHHERAVRLAATRYPELAVEQRFGEHHGDGCDLWVCRAPGSDRVARWADAAGLEVADIRHDHPLDLPTTEQPRPKEQTP
jgi:hypothetical protein